MAYHVKQKGVETPVYVDNNFLGACKWCIKFADLMLGGEFEILSVVKRGRNVTIEKQCEFSTAET